MPSSRFRYTLGMLTTPAKNIFHSHYHQGLLSGIRPRIEALKGRLKIIMMPTKPYKNLPEILRKNRLDGLLILTWRWVHPSITKLIETTSHSRVLVVNDPVPGLGVNSVYVDVEAGIAQAVAHFVKKGRHRIRFSTEGEPRPALQAGRKKIGMLHGPKSVPFLVGKKKISIPFIDTLLKEKGFLKALKAKRIPVNRKWIRSSDANTEAEGYRVMKKWLREKNLPEAIVCGNDDLAFGALRALRQTGRYVPRDIAVIGFDDNEHAKSSTPALTTVRQPLAQMGKDAVDILIRQIQRSGAAIHKKYCPRLIVRRTT